MGLLMDYDEMPPDPNGAHEQEKEIEDALNEASILIEKAIVTTVLAGPRERISRLYHLSLALQSMAQALME